LPIQHRYFHSWSIRTTLWTRWAWQGCDTSIYKEWKRFSDYTVVYKYTHTHSKHYCWTFNSKEVSFLSCYTSWEWRIFILGVYAL